MGDFAILACGIDGCAILLNKHQISSESSSDNDPLVLKVVEKSKLNTSRECEIKSPSDNLNITVVVYGTAEERKKMYEIVKDEMRSYLLSFYQAIPLEFLAMRLGEFLKNAKFSSFHNFLYAEVALASWTLQNGCELFKIDAINGSFKCFGCAIGHQSEKAVNCLSKTNFESLDVQQLHVELMKILLKYSDDDDSIQMSWICERSNGKHQNCDLKLIDEVIKCAEA